MSIENSIAIIGMHGRFPKSSSLEAFWENLKHGKELITFFSDEELAPLKDSLDKYPNYVKAKGYLDEVDYFDAPFFGYTPREAELMDPQQRILLECAWHALEHAGYDPYQHKKQIGVFVGSSISTYFIFNILPHIMQNDWQNPYTQSLAMTGNDKDFLATRISYKLNLTGPSKTIQTACSTSLVAVHDACQNLLDFSCDMALAGGVSITCPLKSGYLFYKEGINSPDGHCRAFDANAQGTLIGNGAGIVVLKRLEDAIQDRDHIHAVILGSAVNNDGNRKLGYTTPSIEGQSEVISEALTLSGVNPETISYIEAHGTGTIIGDPVEIKAISRAFRGWTEKKQFCAIGSVKTNIGHLDAAAGIAGLIKVVLSMKHGMIPPNLHYSSPNPELNIGTTPFYVNNKPQEWKSINPPLRAGISSFGIGGTNAHLILEEAPKANTIIKQNALEHLLLLSAQTPDALRKMKLNLIDALRKNEKNLGDISFTLNTGRKQQPYRTFISSKTMDNAIDQLNDLLEEQVNATPSSTKPLIWIFSNFETHSSDLLINAYPSIKKRIESCLEQFHKLLEKRFTQHPAVVHFSIQYSLSKLLLDLGNAPDQLLGFGIGQYVAAVIANMMTLEDAMKIISNWLAGISSSPQHKITLSTPSITMNTESLLDINSCMEQAQSSTKAYFNNLYPNSTQLFMNAMAPEHPGSHSLELNDSFMKTLGQLWKEGYISRWTALYEGCNYSRTVLPGYPFEKIPYWMSAPTKSIWQENPQNAEKISKPASASMNGLEEQLHNIWVHTFKIENIGIDDNFYTIGGDSLIALDIKSAIRSRFFVDVPLQAFFDNPTIKEMATYIQHLLLNNLSNLDETQTDKILMFLEK